VKFMVVKETRTTTQHRSYDSAQRVESQYCVELLSETEEAAFSYAEKWAGKTSSLYYVVKVVGMSSAKVTVERVE
jgi:hypothetical protein